MADHTPMISREQVLELNQKYGWFQYQDAQSDVSNAFANEAIERYERIRSAAPDLLAALKDLMDTIERVDPGVYDLSIQRAAIAKAAGDA